jgi:hypothetical protein
MDRTYFHRSREKELQLQTFPRFLQRTNLSAVADGRKQEGLILLFGNLPHRIFDTSIS